MKSSSARATVVIGAGYGDEGKGLCTDHYAAGVESPLVVRINGGAQAGHTVVAPDGRRHVFNHVSSGSFAGARTFLSRHFVINPILYFKEQESLGKADLHPEVLADLRAIVTTPYDMLINQIVETWRGDERHGSCGVGFGETIERSLHPQYTITMADLQGRDDAVRARLSAVLHDIRTAWVRPRLIKLGVIEFERSEEIANLMCTVENEDVVDRWIDDALKFREQVEVSDSTVVAQAARRGAAIFEGAQGLLLDQDRGAFPYVTRSNTGLKNVLDVAGEAGIESLEVTYVTRAYVTRHGNGPLHHEIAGPPYSGVIERTNVKNTYQGFFRYAYLDLDILAKAIQADIGDVRGSGIDVRSTLAVTCMDQVDDDVMVIVDGEPVERQQEAFLATALSRTGLDSLLVSRGPSRTTISNQSQAAA